MTGAHRVSRGRRVVLGVLVVVYKDAMPLFFPPFAAGKLRRTPLHLPRQGDGRAPDLREGPAGLDPTVHVEAARAGRLGPPDQSEVFQDFLRHQRHVPDVRPWHPANGVEVDTQLVWPIDVVS